MKVLIFSDIHFHHTHRFSHITPEGFSVRELEHLSCADTILKICKEEGIKDIVFCGDLFGPVGDGLSTETQVVVCKFLEKLQDLNLTMLVGNHDIASQTSEGYVHKLEPYKHWKNIKVIDTPTQEGNFLYMPYCLSDDYAESYLQSIQNKEDVIVFSHLEMKNINLGAGIFTKKGVDIELLDQFKHVFQGHYHNGGRYGKHIYIIGSTQRTSFKDPGLSRNNIIIYDTETDNISKKSFECPDWLTFNDDNIEDVLKIDNNNYVKVDVTTDFLLTKEVLEKLEKVKEKDVHIDISRISIRGSSTEDVIAEDNLGIIKQFVEKSDNTPETKEALVQEGARLLDSVK